MDQILLRVRYPRKEWVFNYVTSKIPSKFHHVSALCPNRYFFFSRKNSTRVTVRGGVCVSIFFTASQKLVSIVVRGGPQILFMCYYLCQNWKNSEATQKKKNLTSVIRSLKDTRTIVCGIHPEADDDVFCSQIAEYGFEAHNLPSEERNSEFSETFRLFSAKESMQCSVNSSTGSCIVHVEFWFYFISLFTTCSIQFSYLHVHWKQESAVYKILLYFEVICDFWFFDWFINVIACFS